MCFWSKNLGPDFFLWVHPNEASKISKLCVHSAPRCSTSGFSIPSLRSCFHVPTPQIQPWPLLQVPRSTETPSSTCWEFFSGFSEKSPCKSQARVLQIGWSGRYEERLDLRQSVLQGNTASGWTIWPLEWDCLGLILVSRPLAWQLCCHPPQNLLTSQTLSLWTWPDDRTAHSVEGGWNRGNSYYTCITGSGTK